MMRLDHQREKLCVRLAGAAVLLCAMVVVGPGTRVVHAQEDDAVSGTPPAVDDAGWDSTADPEDATADTADPSGASADSVLELPQVIAVNHDAAAGASTDPNAMPDPSAAANPTDSASADDAAANQPDNGTTDQASDLAAYAAEGAAGNEVPLVSAPAALPGAAIVSASPLARYAVVGPVWTPGRLPVVPRYAPGPILRTSPMLMTPRGSHITMGGWWHRGR